MTLESGNTIGARIWTDGKQDAPMMPLPPAVVRCSGCGECYWLEEAEEIGTFSPWRLDDDPTDPAWLDAPEVEEPNEEQYYAALDTGLAKDEDAEIQLRILAWWRRNDAFRYADVITESPLTAVAEGNLRELLRLMPRSNPDDLMMRAEVLRELGEPDKAKEELSAITKVEYGPFIHQLRRLCNSGDRAVREFDRDH